MLYVIAMFSDEGGMEKSFKGEKTFKETEKEDCLMRHSATARSRGVDPFLQAHVPFPTDYITVLHQNTSLVQPANTAFF